MKAIFFFFLLFFLMSCAGESILYEINQSPEAKSPTTRITDCRGSSQCLPQVEIYHSASGTVVTWRSNQYTGCTGSFRLNASGAGLTKFEYVNSSGTWYFDHNLSAYSFSYAISCGQYSSCAECKRSGTFVKKENNNGSMGDRYDCQKKYLTYSLVPNNYNSGFKLVLRSNYEDIQNTDDFLAIDSYEIYKSNYGEMLTLVESGTVTSNQGVSSVPNESMQHYNIRLYSSKCEDKRNHYLYGSYQGDGQNKGLDIYNLTENKGH